MRPDSVIAMLRVRTAHMRSAESKDVGWQRYTPKPDFTASEHNSANSSAKNVLSRETGGVFPVYCLPMSWPA